MTTTPPALGLRADATVIHPMLHKYAERAPIGEVTLGPAYLTVYTPAQAREIAAAFTKLADEFQAYEDSHCPECFAETPPGDPSPVHTEACPRGGAR